MKPRVLVIGQLPPPVHGSNVMTERFMDALVANGYPASIVEKTFSQRMDQVGRISLKKLAMVPDLCRRVITALETDRPDCCVYFISVGLRSLLVDCFVLSILRRRGIRYLLYFHGKGYRVYESRKYLPVRGLIRSALANAWGGLVLGERLKDDVAHYLRNERLYILPNGIPANIGADGNVEKERGGSLTVAFLSNLIPAKGPLRFLQMAKLVHAVDTRVRFVVAGRHTSDRYLAELQDYIRESGLEGCVELPGPVYGEEKDQLFHKMDVLVFPTSFDKETFGIVNIEAMHYGVPVISSPVGAIPEIIRDGINGYIVAPDDIATLAERVITLVRDPDLRRRMGAAGRQLFARHYSLEAYSANVRRALDFFLSPAESLVPTDDLGIDAASGYRLEEQRG